MEHNTTRQRILLAALELFSRQGYDAVSVGQIAEAVGIRAPSLYKHYKSKRDIFQHILLHMERQDAEQAAACSLPEGTAAEMPEAYAGTALADLIAFCRQQFRYWTEDPFAAAFRRMLTVEQYHGAEMNRLYQQYLGSGPLAYTADLLGSREEALSLCGPMHLLYSVYDAAEDKTEVQALLEAHLARCLENMDMGKKEQT